MPVTKSPATTQKAGAAGLILWEYYDSSFGSYFDCVGSPGGCGATITVSGASNSDILADIYQAIETQNNSEVSALFSQHQNQLNELFDENIVSGMIEGTLSLEKGRGGQDDPAIYLLFKNMQGELELAQPIIN